MQLFAWTGNLWVDAGLAAIIEWRYKTSPEEISNDDIAEMSKTIQDIYLSEGWKRNLFSVFPNNPITNPAVKDKKHRLAEHYKNFTEGILPMGDKGNCIACGRRKVVNGKNRMDVPLTGYEGSHFFSFKTEGADYCDACTFAVQCSPLVYYACGKLLLLHSSSPKIMRFWAKRCIADVQKQIATRNYSGCFNEQYSNATNALFHIIQDLILSYDERWIDENASIRLYHFTNYNQGADLDIYDLPAQVFRFLAYIRPHPRYRDWQKVVRKGYNKDLTGKKEDEYRNYKNSVYLSLLEGRSIVKYFLNNKAKEAIGDWNLLKYYLKEVRRMDEKRIEAIRKLGDEIAEIVKTSSNGKKRLGQLERAESYASLRNVLLRLMRDRVALKGDVPLFTYEDYVESFFPEGVMNWRETQDLLLFRLYEVLHQWLISEGVVEIEEESEEVSVS
ncbi:MAG: type I-B CRISPR-associated protein Cas8b1/Cst1 [Nitrospirae bacterium]|nr:type I-B CRISPR-associated protein Cas8b1/Cst1 [Nitrospirota bacterium]